MSEETDDRSRHWRHYHREDQTWEFLEESGLDPQVPDGLEMFVVYREPNDYPDKCVVRRWIVRPDDRWIDPVPYAVTDTLDEARLKIQPAPRMSLGRYNDPEDPSVYEAWI